MSRALATGVSTGTSLAVLWKVLEGVQYPPVSLCPQPSLFDLHWPSLLFGVTLGLLLGPIFEALVALRLWVYQATIRRLLGQLPAGVNRGLFRLL